jgi:hypothetical protein
MIKRALVVGLVAVVATAILVSCNSSTTTTQTQGSGNLITLIGDAPLCNVGTMHFLVSGLRLYEQGSTAYYAILNPNTSSFKVNFGLLRDSDTILNYGTFPAGTYDQGIIYLALGQFGVFDPSLIPPAPTLVSGFLTNSTPKFTISPPLVVAPGKLSVLRIDFDLLRSLQIDANGQVLKDVTPVFTASPVPASSSGDFGELDDLTGFVRTVTPSTAGTSFVGNFTLQLLSGSLPQGPAVSINYTADTKMYGVASLNDLTPGSVVEVNGYIDGKGNLVGSTVDVEGQEDPANNRIAMIGPITSITTDPAGDVTQFTMWMQDQQPDDISLSPDSELAVNISTSSTAPTTYDYSSRSVNFTSPPLDFGPSALGLGQRVVVFGPYARAGTGQSLGLTTVAAEKIFLKMQTLQGSFSRLVQANADDQTGAFQLAPCCTLLQGPPIYVLTTGLVASPSTGLPFQTTFLNVAGLNQLNTQATLLVKGLAFFQPNGTTINGIPIPPGTLVVLAKQVHQL